MRLLLDTHTLLWWATDRARVSPAALAACEDASNVLLLSVVSVWEMQIKAQLGKLTLTIPLATLIDRVVNTNGMTLQARTFLRQGEQALVIFTTGGRLHIDPVSHAGSMSNW